MSDRIPTAYRCAACGCGWAVPFVMTKTQYPACLSFPCPKCSAGTLVADYHGRGPREDDYIDFLIAEAFHPGSTVGFFEES